MNGATDHTITTIEALERHYGAANPNSLFKELDHVHPHYRAMIEAAPFVAIATVGAEGTDCTPRGDAPGFVHIQDEHTLLIPDRPGNNRLDTLRNLLADPRVSLLFLIPGVGETLRVNGRAAISVDPALLARFAVNGKPPRSVLVVSVDRVYFQCSKAVVRSRLWDAATQIPRSALPSTGTMLRDFSAGAVDGEAYDRALPARLPGQLY